MKVVELFCGVGLSSLGVVKSGATLVGANDIQPDFIRCFNSQKILPPVGISCNLDNYNIPECDLISAGPVCKAFSPGSTVFGTKGSEDERNTFPLLFKAIERSLPKYILIENSFGLQRFKGYIQEIISKIQNYGYTITWGEVDCYDYGVPQHRRRVVFLCSKGKTWTITKPDTRVGPSTVGDCFYKSPEEDSLPLTRPMTEGELGYWNRDPRHAKKHPPLEMNKPSSTVVSNYKRGVPYGVVNLNGQLHMCNPRLASRLQGVPDEYSLNILSKTKTLEGLGNGFPPPVVEHLIRSLF